MQQKCLDLSMQDSVKLENIGDRSDLIRLFFKTYDNKVTIDFRHLLDQKANRIDVVFR